MHSDGGRFRGVSYSIEAVWPASLVLYSRKVIVFDDPQGPIYKSLSLSLDHKVLENCQWLSILQTVCYVSSREVQPTAAEHEEYTVKNVLLADVIYYLLI